MACTRRCKGKQTQQDMNYNKDNIMKNITHRPQKHYRRNAMIHSHHINIAQETDTPHTQTPKKWITIQNTTRIHKKINLNTQHHKTQKMKNHDTTAAARGGVQKRAIATSRQLARLHVSLYQPQGYALQRPLQG